MIPAHPIASAYWGCLWFGPVPGPVFSFGISQNITGNWRLSLPLDNVSTSFRSTLPLLWPELLHIGHIVLGGALPTNRIYFPRILQHPFVLCVCVKASIAVYNTVMPASIYLP